MLKAEEKIRNCIDKLIPVMGVLFVMLASFLIRWTGKKYIGLDFHFTIYDVEENVCPLPYRTLAIFLGAKSEHVIMLMKFLIYFGDICTAVLALIYLKNHSKLQGIELIFTTTVLFLLNPVILMNGITAMKPDSLCMALLLCGLLLADKEKYLPALGIASMSLFISHLYLPVIIAAAVWVCVKKKKYLPAAVSVAFIVAAILIEQLNTNDFYYFGKVFVNYKFMGCLILYGYFIPVSSLLLAIKKEKYRLPSLMIHLVYIMYSGWVMTSHFAL